ncbi:MULTISPECIES: DUF6069 family protein [Actinomycetes]|uniref:DUF4267 domain-containing protein n=2 Tax=Actinomycetes TaxID=1760 RepID=A0ABP6LYW0_9MICC
MSTSSGRSSELRRPLPTLGAVVVLVATLLNLGVFFTAHALGASLRLDPLGQEPGHLLRWVDVAWKTALPLAIGIGLVALLRRSRRGLLVLLVAVLIVFGPTSAVPPSVAHDGITAAALALLHLIPLAAFTVVALRVRSAQPATRPRAARSVAT